MRDINPSVEVYPAKRLTIGGVQVVPRGHSSMAIVPTMGSTQGSLIKGEAGLGTSVAATTLNVVV